MSDKDKIIQERFGALADSIGPIGAAIVAGTWIGLKIYLYIRNKRKDNQRVSELESKIRDQMRIHKGIPPYIKSSKGAAPFFSVLTKDRMEALARRCQSLPEMSQAQCYYSGAVNIYKDLISIMSPMIKRCDSSDLDTRACRADWEETIKTVKSDLDELKQNYNKVQYKIQKKIKLGFKSEGKMEYKDTVKPIGTETKEVPKCPEGHRW